MPDCIFCKLAAGDIPSNKAWEDDEILAFHDINPQAPVHILVIPKAHVAAGVMDIDEGNCAVAGRCIAIAAQLANELNLTDGFRVVANNGPAACQTVPHLHFHLLAGRQLSGIMG